MLVETGKVLAKDVVFYRNVFARGFGLRFRKPKKDHAIVLTSNSESVSGSSIDMFFVFYPIDVLWLDSKFRIVDVKTNLKPFSGITKPKFPAKYVVELPAGTVEDSIVGGRVVFKRGFC
ncbi:MAG: DUF192 domain-containing protein [Candidatus Nanoarchaeia archaeon]